MNLKKGFTLIEILVVVAIIGLLSTLALVALGTSRQRARDARRVSDIRQIQTALESYLNDNRVYPIADTGISLGRTGATRIGSVSGFTDSPTASETVYMVVPDDPARPAKSYVYTAPTPGLTYTITFTLEGGSGTLGEGVRTAAPDGVR